MKYAVFKINKEVNGRVIIQILILKIFFYKINITNNHYIITST